MLNFFPCPYPDEDFGSIIHRYFKLSGRPHMKDIMNKLFQVKTVRNRFILPKNLLILLNNILGEHSYSLERIVKEHSYLPLMKPFYLAAEYHNIIEDIGMTKGRIVVGSDQLRHMISNQVRYCPQCLLEDYQKFGESYVHRIHQYKFVQVCPNHHTYLISSCPECQQPFLYHNRRLLGTPYCSNKHYLPSFTKHTLYTETLEKLIHQVADDTKFLIYNEKDINIELIRQRYRGHSLKKGYFSPNGLMQKNKSFIQDFFDFFSEKNLEVLGIKINQIHRKFAQVYFNLQSNHYNILIHILLMIYFSGSVSNFLNQTITDTEPFIPFGQGPWECLNELCSKYKQNSIEACQRYSFRDVIYGKFQCEKCGYTYTKKCNRATLQNLDGIYVRDRGWLWDKKEEEIYKLYEKEIQKAQILNKRNRILDKKIQIPERNSFAWINLLFQVYANVKSYKETARILKTTEITVKNILIKHQKKTA
ncbi:TnsD family Tn7-like transposition protein [Paenibacillus allorhizosphaerae]|uniref:TnsD family Tn7-like transposition protein n=2 Tax=Paenibacillus allorhizosphaerae TaxID=2849866 RepID=UPI003623E508